MKLFPNAWTILIAWCAWLAASVQGAIEFRAVTDFSTSNGNPNGVWSYGWRPAGTSEFNLMENTVNNRWYHGNASGPFIESRNNLIMFGTPNSDVPVLRWTAPYDMPVAKMYALFFPSIFKIQLNGQDLDLETFGDMKVWQPFYTFQNGLHQGDTLDFVFPQISIPLSVDICVLPEPDTYLAGLGLLGLFAWIGSKSIRSISR